MALFFYSKSIEIYTLGGCEMDGKNILQTLIELLEAQEQIKITYTIKEIGVEDEKQSIKNN